MQEKNGDAEKICLQCNNLKPLSNYSVRSKYKDGRDNKCRECRRRYIFKKCELCEIVIDVNFVKNFNIKNYSSLHGFCRCCRKRLRKFQLIYGGKTCSKCNISKPFGEFPFHKKTYDGFDSWCKECRRHYRHEANQSLDTHVRSKIASIRDDRRKIFCDIDIQYLINLWNSQKGVCAISGISMSHQRNKRIHNQFNGSVDRIDSTKGYVRGNVQWVCWSVNRMKGENSLDQLLEWCKNIIKHSSKDL